MLKYSNRLGTKGAYECGGGDDCRVMVADLIVKGLELHRDAYIPLSMS